MACDPRWEELLSASHDGEAASEERMAVDHHLRTCLACRRSRLRMQALTDALGTVRTARYALHGAGRRPRRVGSSLRLATAALLVVLAAGMAERLRVRSGRSSVVDELEARHLTAFSRPRPCDFSASDPSSVRAWARSELGRDVEVPAIPGATLLGARRCRLSGVPTIAILYRLEGEPISVFFPPPRTPTERERRDLTAAPGRCTAGTLGAAVCAGPDVLAVASDIHSARRAAGELEGR